MTLRITPISLTSYAEMLSTEAGQEKSIRPGPRPVDKKFDSFCSLENIEYFVNYVFICT